MSITVSPLGEQAIIVMGQSPPGESYNDEGTGAPLLNGPTEFGPQHPTARQWTTSPTKFCKPGDVLFCVRGATAGKINVADKEYCLGRGLAAIRPRSGKFDASFLLHVLKNGYAKFQSRGVGSTFINISSHELANFEVPTLPLPEQRRIGAALDRAEALRTQRRAAIAQLDELTQAIFVDMFGDPIANEKGWKSCSLGAVATKITDGTHKTPRYTESGIEFLSAKDLKEGGIAWGTGKFISEQEHRELVRRCDPEIGDVLMAKSGSLGFVAIIDRSHEFSLFESLCLIKHDRLLIEGAFLVGVLRNPSMLAHLLGKNKGIAIKHLHLVDVRELQLPLPPMDLQRNFARRIAAIDQLKSAHRTSLTELDALFATLQDRAFRGEL